MDDSRTLRRDIGRAELVDELRGMQSRFVHAGVTGVTLFGSRARQDNRAESDIDLVIDVASDRKFSLLDLIAVEHAVEDQIGLPANIFMRRSLDPGFLDTARRDGILIFRG